ncbi:endonuclease Q family protein [Geomonas sp. Red69]|uniref:endonuclease Q family protein n=1 Tax=Geomonas diazotrophica TaxID=2843197 RepID=UPI001C106B4D|nr:MULTISPECIES: endonuclease Q family protein [Geomonas]MBU5637696.1 endonuclease Q family protein [Geomonas diazotrophica]QXE85302.1 endonuclease Q family protein [Geomonas nitrogeniifigens]
MRFTADLHIHSRFSRATSRDLNLDQLWRWAQLKGIRVVGTGDCTHPGWLAELEQELVPAENGLLRLRREPPDGQVPDSCRAPVSFLLSGEISCIYRKGGRTRKVHCLVLLPDFEAAHRLNLALSRVGTLASDGRPILKLDAKDLLAMVLQASPRALLVPAHAWTPHFSIFGACSGFESLQECFEELAPEVHAIETGLSSDPAMNWRLSVLDGITLISNSDAHSASKLGREATLFDAGLCYQGIYQAIVGGKGVAGTIEFFPEQGKYHADGHRCCGVRLSPEQTIAHGYRCPTCGGKLTVGVLHRVELLADRAAGARPEQAPPFWSVIPLIDLIGGALRVGSSSKKAETLYFELLERLGNEFHILLDASLNEIAARSTATLAAGIGRMRAGEVEIEPGYDGKFGTVSVSASEEDTT